MDSSAPRADRPAESADVLPQIQRLTAGQRWWKNAALVSSLAFGVLFLCSFLQFLGAFLSWQQVHAAQRDAAAAREARDQAWEALEHIRQMQIDVAVDRTAAARARIECQTHLGRMQREIGDAKVALERNRQDLRTLQALREEEERRLARLRPQLGTMTINGQVYHVRGPTAD